jgi:hypothetical protein
MASKNVNNATRRRERSRVQKVVLHPAEDGWRKTEGRKNNALRIRLCVKNAGKELFALTS